MQKLNNIKAFFLDFDGVILESVTIKTQAFYDLFVPYGINIAEQAVNYHLAHQGINRLSKFVHIGEYIIKKPFSEQMIKKLSDEFKILVFNKILQAPFVAGVENFLINQYIEIPKFVLSATPEDELIEICKIKKIEHYFKEIHGSPRSKTEIGYLIKKNNGYNATEIIFIGDSIQDYYTSCELGTNFIGRLTHKNHNPFPESILTITDFTEL